MVDGGWWMDRYWKTYLIPNGFIVGAIPCGCPLYESFSFGWECIHFGQPYFLGYKSYWVNFDYYGVTAEYWVNAVYWATTRDCPYGRTDGWWMVNGGWLMVNGGGWRVNGRWLMVDGGWWMDRYWKTYLIPNGFIVGAIPCGCPLYESFSFGWECIHFGQPYFLGYKSYWVNFDYYGVTAEYWVNAVYWATTRDCPYGRTDGWWMVNGEWWRGNG